MEGRSPDRTTSGNNRQAGRQARLMSTGMDAVAAGHLTHAFLPCLEQSLLTNNNLNAAAVTKLQKGRWPHLKTFSGIFGGSSVQLVPSVSAATAALVHCDFSKLEVLALPFSNFDGAAARELRNAHWPRMQTLDLTRHQLDTAAVAEVSMAN